MRIAHGQRCRCRAVQQLLAASSPRCLTCGRKSRALNSWGRFAAEPAGFCEAVACGGDDAVDHLRRRDAAAPGRSRRPSKQCGHRASAAAPRGGISVGPAPHPAKEADLALLLQPHQRAQSQLHIPPLAASPGGQHGLPHQGCSYPSGAKEQLRLSAAHARVVGSRHHPQQA